MTRYRDVSVRKSSGATYTPPELAEYLASKLAAGVAPRACLRVLDPAIGDGSLMAALLGALRDREVQAVGLDTDPAAVRAAATRLPGVEVRVRSFLDYSGQFDLIIANPPYVRTQVLGAAQSRDLARRFGLTGRVDLYQAFLLVMIDCLAPGGRLAVITSNRLLTIRGAARLREVLRDRLAIERVWDLGDTKLFDAAVLPAMIVGARGEAAEAAFTSIYEIPGQFERAPIVSSLDRSGDFTAPDGRSFRVQQGRLSRGDVWRISDPEVEAWLTAAGARTWRTLGDLGKIRVGVKTTADAVFIRENWGHSPPELLRPLITHHVAARYRASPPSRRILYPHEARKTPADLRRYPRARRYLESHRAELEARHYVREARREWYEIWVPHDPGAWSKPKLVFRDISEEPTFWLDASGAVVNGDCYWLDAPSDTPGDHLWLALAVANSSFAVDFYDRSFNNRLYAGRRRFITQYVQHFPLPDPTARLSRQIVDLSRRRFDAGDSALEPEIDTLVKQSFGVR